MVDDSLKKYKSMINKNIGFSSGTIVFLTIVFVIGFFAFLFWLEQSLWNNSITVVFGTPKIGYWGMASLSVLIMLLFNPIFYGSKRTK